MDEIRAAQSLGLTLPSPAYLAGAILFGLIGFAAWRYGKKTSRSKVKWIGVGLMLYPYVVPHTGLVYLIGTGLCAALIWYRE